MAQYSLPAGCNTPTGRCWIYLKIRNGVIEDISHETRGCMIAVAAASVVSEYAKGKSLNKNK